MTKKETLILETLNYLLDLDDVLACMVARKGMEGIVPNFKSFKIRDMGIWQILQRTMDEFFDVIKAYAEYGLDKIYFELGNYDVMFFVLPQTDTALVVIVPALANRGLIEVEVENARRKLIKILKDS